MAKVVVTSRSALKGSVSIALWAHQLAQAPNEHETWRLPRFSWLPSPDQDHPGHRRPIIKRVAPPDMSARPVRSAT